MHSILSFPARGPWGDSRYPGNLSGYVVRALIQHYRPRRVADPCEGSGTTKALCASLGLPYWGSDLREGFDLTATPLIQAAPWNPDLIVLHPPYFRIIRYSGTVWGKEPDPRDLSHESDWEHYLTRLHLMVEHARMSLAPKGHLAVIIGDVRQLGHYFSAQSEVLRWFEPSEIDAVVIKAQHGVSSNQKSYAGPLIRIMHEYVLVVRAIPGARHAP